MSDFNWCHGPQCHEKHTVDRVRGVKGSKVLRTRKIKLNHWNSGNVSGVILLQSTIAKMISWKTYVNSNRCHCAEDRVPGNSDQ